jgi:class 3 adenylate cyclase
VKTLEKDTTARFDPETQPSPAQAAPVPGMDMLAGEMTITIMFTDIVGSTAMNQLRLGDQQTRQLMRA